MLGRPLLYLLSGAACALCLLAPRPALPQPAPERPPAQVADKAADKVADKAAPTAPDAALDASIQQTLRPPEHPLVGQPIPMTVEIRHPAGTQVLAPEAPTDPRIAMLPPRLTTLASEQGQRTTIQLDWMVWRPGTTTLPSLEIVVMDDAGQARSLHTEVETLRVDGQLSGDQDPSLTGPLGPLRIFREDQRGLAVMVGSAAVGLLLLGLLAFMARRLKPEIIPAAPKPAHQQAIDALQALSEEDLIARGQTLPYYERLSEIVRDYMGRRYGFPGTELTSSEILARLADVRWPSGISAEEIRRWLQHTDMVKFAGERPDAPRAAEALRHAFSIVELTRPVAALTAAAELDGAQVEEASPGTEEAPPGAEETHTGTEEAHTEAEEAPPGAEEAHTSTEEAHTGAEEAHTSAEEAHTGAEEAHTEAEEAPPRTEEAHTGAEDIVAGDQAAPRIKDPLLAALLRAQDEEEQP
jgi:hypothetical protein